MKIAIYKSSSLNFSQIIEVEDYYENSTDHTRLTEPLEIEFIYLPPEVTIPPQLAALDAQILREDTLHHEKVTKLKEQKSKLLALIHEV